MKVKIAVSYKGGEIYEHFGHAECFAIYEYEDADVSTGTKRLIDVSDRHGHDAMVELMLAEDVSAVICGNMGGEAKALLLSNAIIPVIGYCGEADTAADLLIQGRLPILPGEGGCGCGGSEGHGCGGCSGCGGDEGEGCGCGDEDAGSCGCGGSCGCH
ncbi:MAG: NifB/NifX family molybdenum-iron cluster-binding protein [Oscillospiraceae bacterium]|nr:NifB/NifX family molybdenum-iron cluster-binding protein [Oscillospiraceae bacterium]